MRTILLIEDNDDIRENTAEILELAGYAVVTAENGKVGVEKAQQAPPDLVICDIMMPVLDGYGVLRIFSGHPSFRRCRLFSSPPKPNAPTSARAWNSAQTTT